uniref:Transcription factor E2F7 n=1 Tax=Mola mola TaxID=94237 RepID=A0A3Q4B5T5_MOLML
MQENICTERRKSPPLQSEATVPTLLINRKGATPDLTHITPIKHTSLVEPWTPTANLKMLISAASPDIREREMRKVLFRPIENDSDKPASPRAVVEDTEVDDSCQGDADKKPSRKQKSLGLLCQKFLALYPKHPQEQNPIWISLDEVASSLGVERRRIYDIVNVLESVTIVGRIAKNSYTWYGQQRLEATLEELQQRGRQQGYHLQMELAILHDSLLFVAAGNRKDKSLRIMSQKFVMLFLVSTTQTVTLDTAAKILIEESQDSLSHSKYKTKVRRLYDIANVLTSLGLIKKVHVREERGRKPAFVTEGPPSSLALNSGGVPTVALPFVLLPSASLSHYPLVASSLPQQGSDAHNKLSFRPTVMPPAHFMVGAVPYSLTAASEMRKSPAASPTTPEHSRLYESAVTVFTPQTPKETTQSASKAFFQTPGTLGSVVSSVPAARKRGSAQRRLDVGHHPNS